jgi:hypothetical protein
MSVIGLPCLLQTPRRNACCWFVKATSPYWNALAFVVDFLAWIKPKIGVSIATEKAFVGGTVFYAAIPSDR